MNPQQETREHPVNRAGHVPATATLQNGSTNTSVKLFVCMDKHDLIWPVKVEKVTEYKYLGIVLEISWLLDTIFFLLSRNVSILGAFKECFPFKNSCFGVNVLRMCLLLELH